MQRNLARNFLSLLLALGTSGCATAYKNVMISVVDETTGKPIAGAKVTTDYFQEYPFSRVSRKASEGVTGTDGTAILSANYKDGVGPWYDVEIRNADYVANSSVGISPDTATCLSARAQEFIPTKPDVQVELRSESEKASAMARFRLKQKQDEAQAEVLFHQSPDFWPDHKEEPYPYVSDDVGGLLIGKRWNAGSVVPLGTTTDIKLIRGAVLARITEAHPRINEIRWLSSTSVMASASWYVGPLGAGGYTYVLRKGSRGWVVLTYYMEWIS
jgi:hypothetical protein